MPRNYMVVFKTMFYQDNQICSKRLKVNGIMDNRTDSIELNFIQNSLLENTGCLREFVWLPTIGIKLTQRTPALNPTVPKLTLLIAKITSDYKLQLIAYKFNLTFEGLLLLCYQSSFVKPLTRTFPLQLTNSQ